MTTRVRKITPPKSKQRTIVGIAMDSSGSMSHLRGPAVQAADSILQGIKEEAAKTGIETLYTFLTFDSAIQAHVQAAPIDGVQSVASQYRVKGNTKLLDGCHFLIDSLNALDTPDTSFLVYVVTDGQENDSRTFSNPALLKDKMKKLVQTDRWTFGFHMPPGGKKYALNLGIDADHIREWEPTARGVAEMANITRTATAHVYATKSSRGVSAKVSNLFTTDLSNLSAKVLHTKLDDISDHFKEFEVKDESRIDEFTAKKTKKEYVYGQSFYQLMKTETIQPTKQVLIQEKGKKAVWGGDQARDLIGLPKAASGVSIKVKPGNHANFDVFIQSASPNRKLPRGTKILIDMNMKTGVQPTWDVSALATV